MPASLLVHGVCLALYSAASSLAGAPGGVSGDYVEIRSCDVFTGPCFANGEMNLTGGEAVLGWSIRAGQWRGVDLAGLGVVAVVKADGTLGDVARFPREARSVVIVDDRADARQFDALVDFARHAGGRLTSEVVRIESAPIDMLTAVSTCKENGCALVTAGELVEIQTRCLGGDDHVCGNEERFYPPLTKIENARPAFTEVGLSRADGLGLTFDEAGRRSAYLGTFHEAN